MKMATVYSPVVLGLVFILLTSIGGAFGFYAGKKIGDLSQLQHDVSGSVFVANANTIRLTEFNYDGTGPKAYFYVGTTGDVPHGNGRIIPDEKGTTDPLPEYRNRMLLLTLPPDVNLHDVRWFSVWCDEFSVDFGNVVIPTSFQFPGPVVIGRFGQQPPIAHDFKSEEVTVVDSKTITIKSIFYDGRGPDAFFILGKNSVGSSGYTKIVDERNSTTKLNGYAGQDITLVLPQGVSIHSFGYISMYCILFKQDFGHLIIPTQLDVPLHPVSLSEEARDGSSELENCESLDSGFNVGWQVNSTHITFEFVSALEVDRYMAFGLSGSDSRSVMKGGDVIVTRYESGIPYATDYFLDNYAQCSQDTGSCPDTNFGGQQDARVISGSEVGGIVRVKVIRRLDTGDAQDKVYTPGQEQSIIWALGGLNQETLVTKHDMRITGDKKLDFGRTPSRNCGTISLPKPPTGQGWKEQRLSGRDHSTFHVSVGLTGGEKGYKAITGQQSWGIAYYINGFLIPRLELKRGENYTFIIEAGDDTSNTAKYHPFYLTTDPRGGYNAQSLAERNAHEVFLGIDSTGRPQPNAVGQYCEWESSLGLEGEKLATFEQFKQTLSYKCDQGADGPKGVMKFSPDGNTPDRLFYQCFSHYRLGWKIDIVDEYTSGCKPSGPTPSIHLCSFIFSFIVGVRFLHHSWMW